MSELFGVIIIKSASHHSAPSTYLHAVNLIIIGSSIINMVDINNAVSQSYHPVLDTHITSQRVTWITAVSGFMASTLSSPRHGACAYPTLTSDDKKHSTRKFGLKFRVGPETSRLLRLQMYPSQLDSLRPENATRRSRH